MAVLWNILQTTRLEKLYYKAYITQGFHRNYGRILYRFRDKARVSSSYLTLNNKML